MIENSVGRPVRGANFFDREAELKALWGRLATDHVLMLAPRRVGKTSILLRLMDEAPQHDFHAVYLSVAHAQRELDFVKSLVEALAEAPEAESAIKRVLKGPLKRFFRMAKRIDAGPVSIELDTAHPEATAHWSALGEELADALEHLGHRWLVLVDELPIFILTLIRADPTGGRARGFLNWFRQLRNPTSLQSQLRWVLAGSIGLDAVVARMKVGDTINDLNPMPLGAFSPPTAHAFLDALGESYEIALPVAVKDRICERAGWLIPFWLQVIFSRLRDVHGDTDIPPTPDTVDEAIEALLGPAYRLHFDYWRQRLTEELDRPHDAYALSLLSAAARSTKGASRTVLNQVLTEHIRDGGDRDTQLRFLLDVLENDGYLIRDGDRWRFRSALLREFWLRRVG